MQYCIVSFDMVTKLHVFNTIESCRSLTEHQPKFHLTNQLSFQYVSLLSTKKRKNINLIAHGFSFCFLCPCVSCVRSLRCIVKYMSIKREKYNTRLWAISSCYVPFMSYLCPFALPKNLKGHKRDIKLMPNV